MDAFDVLVLGAGPGGYTAAIRCAQRGLPTAVVEAEDLGGVCLNRGCIPSKAMLRSAEVLDLLRRATDYGLAADNVAGHYEMVVDRRDRIVAQLLQGVTHLLSGNGVKVLRGTGRLVDAHRVEVVSEAGVDLVEFRNLIVATGSRAAPLPVPGGDLPGVIDSDGALELRAAPGRVVIVGGGAVGVEWAEIFHAFGGEVTVLEMLPQIIPTEEPEIARELGRAFGRKGIACHSGVRVTEIRESGDALTVQATAGGKELSFEADVVLAAVGRRPNIEQLNLGAAGVVAEPRAIRTDEHMRTNVPHIYAIGDATGRYLLAHVASHQGLVAAESIAGNDEHTFDERIVPAAIFTHPEVASVGLQERQAAERGINVKTGRFPFAASGRALASGETSGFVKIVADSETSEVLGVHIIGPNAGDLVAEAALALHFRATLDDLAATIHVHPTFSEALMEAALLARGTPIHVPPRRRASADTRSP